MVTVIGDVHGKLDEYKALTERYGRTIQIGDFGFKKQFEWHEKNINPDKHKLFKGNHDNYLNDKEYDFDLGDYGYIVELDIFFIRGAKSNDKHYRTEGIDWFENEQLTYSQFNNAIVLYEKIKPSIVLSHDCPQTILDTKFSNLCYEKTTTRNGLNAMFDVHQPLLWIFGHHHHSMNFNLKNTNFICLDELETYTIR